MPFLSGIFIYHRTASHVRVCFVFRELHLYTQICKRHQFRFFRLLFSLSLIGNYNSRGKGNGRNVWKWKRGCRNRVLCCVALKDRNEIDTNWKSIEIDHFEHVSIAARFYKCQFNCNLPPNAVSRSFFMKFLKIYQRKWKKFHQKRKELPKMQPKKPVFLHLRSITFNIIFIDIRR